jgi:ribonucleoside-diphosphate reductase alpha chain
VAFGSLLIGLVWFQAWAIRHRRRRCGTEATLLPYEACDLGSINLHKFYDEKTNSIDFEFLEYVVRSSVRFLDDVLDVSEAPIEKINYYSKGLRRLGLGVFGFADLLAELEIPYNSQKGKDLARYLSWFISFFTWLESMELSKEKGPFPLYNSKEVDLGIVEKVLNSEYNPGKFDMEEVRKVGLRNVSVTAIAPTGSIALIAGENSGIEPFFALAYKRSITQGIGNTEKSFILELNPVLFNKLNKYGIDQEKVKSYILENGSIQGCELVPEHLQKVFATAMEINWKDHIDMQASWQEFVTNAVSKTINMENSATVEDIKEAFIYAWGKGLKGITAYRDGSKSFQILNVLRKKSEKKSA